MTALRWGIKKSLHEYVRSSEGSIEVGDGAWLEGDEVVFPGAGSDGESFTGYVRFIAHGGMMDWRLADPQFQEGATVISLAGRRGARVDFATIDDGIRLTVDGAVMLGGFYPAGTVLDPLSVT